MSIKNSNDTNANRTRALPACSLNQMRHRLLQVKDSATFKMQSAGSSETRSVFCHTMFRHMLPDRNHTRMILPAKQEMPSKSVAIYITLF
jgi:hypothetical protein